MEGTKENIIRSRFTGYVLVALKRAKKDYIRRESKIIAHESLSDEPRFTPSLDVMDSIPFSWECAGEIPQTPEAVRKYMEKQVGDEGKAALDTLTETEVLVVFMKVFKQMTYVEIGNHLGIDWKKAGSVYAYARKKMQKGWKSKDGIL